MVHQHGVSRRLLLSRRRGRCGRRTRAGAAGVFRARARTARIARHAVRTAGVARAGAGTGRGTASRRPRARLRRAAGRCGARRGTRPRRSRGAASDLLRASERRIHRGGPRCPGQRRNAQHAGTGARTKAQSCRSIGRNGAGLRPFDRHRAHRARRTHGAGLNFAHLAVKPQRRFQRDNHRAGPIIGNHCRDCGHVTADARNHQGERRGRKRHHGTGDAGLPPQPARAARRAVGSGEHGRRARGRTDGAASRRRLLGGRLRARSISDGQIRRVASRQISRVVGSQTSRIAGSRTRRIIDGRIRRVAGSQISRIVGDQVRRVASRQVCRIALVVMRVLSAIAFPPFPVRLKSRRLSQAWPVLLTQSLVSGYCNRIA